MLIGILLSLIAVTAAIDPWITHFSLRDGDSSCYQAGINPVGVVCCSCQDVVVTSRADVCRMYLAAHPSMSCRMVTALMLLMSAPTGLRARIL